MNRFAPPGTRNGGGVAARSPIRWALSRTKTRRTMPESTLGSVSRTSPQTRHVSDPRSYWFPQHRQLSVTTGSSHRATCRGRRIRPLPAAGALVTGLAPQTARPTNTAVPRIIVSLARGGDCRWPWAPLTRASPMMRAVTNRHAHFLVASYARGEPCPRKAGIFPERIEGFRRSTTVKTSHARSRRRRDAVEG